MTPYTLIAVLLVTSLATLATPPASAACSEPEVHSTNGTDYGSEPASGDLYVGSTDAWVAAWANAGGQSRGVRVDASTACDAAAAVIACIEDMIDIDPSFLDMRVLPELPTREDFVKITGHYSLGSGLETYYDSASGTWRDAFGDYTGDPDVNNVKQNVPKLTWCSIQV